MVAGNRLPEPQIVDVVTATRRGTSLVLTVPARLRRELGIRPGDRFAVYLTYDDESETEGILYIPVRSGRARPGGDT